MRVAVTNEFSIKDAKVRVGLEIHQQLDTGKKLFCRCASAESTGYTTEFERRLRVSRGEQGAFDAAVLFESAKSKSVRYYADDHTSCLVEQDEAPPNELDSDAKRIALTVCAALNSNVYTEIYPMRKTVIDGSNTTGFQRTMVVSRGGFYGVGKEDRKIGIQSICLEEDAAKILGDKGQVREYGLERLGVPLVEIATEPFEMNDTHEIKDIALSLGRILRSTKKVKRGLGTIRQDVNVSIGDGNGVVIEVKGVQQLEQLEKVVEYEAKRQRGLVEISKRIKDAGWQHANDSRKDVTALFAGSQSKIIQKAIKSGHAVTAIVFGGMSGLFGYAPYEGIRLGREIAELVRFFGIGGVFHSDEELTGYGIVRDELDQLIEMFGMDEEKDAFLILAAPKEKTDVVVRQIVSRVEYIRDNGIPVDTRLATMSGETKFLRPRPGDARMYPETDIPVVSVTREEWNAAVDSIPKSWDESIKEIQTKHGINAQLAEQLFDSQYMNLFEEIVNPDGTTGEVSPTFVASMLCSSITNLERSGLNPELLKDADIARIFGLLENKEIAKESVEVLFEGIMSAKIASVDEALEQGLVQVVDAGDLEGIIKGIIEENRSLIANQGQRAVKPLMGIAMKKLRGKASGETVNRMLSDGIKEVLK